MDYTVRLAMCECTDPDCDVHSCEDLLPLPKDHSVEEAAGYLEKDAIDLRVVADNLFATFKCDSFEIRVDQFLVTFSKAV
ncbi:MAG: hypothetical protein RIS64_3674 [Bacteroidota bacterium]